MEQHDMTNGELSEQELARVAGAGDVDIFHDTRDRFPPTAKDHIVKYRTVYEKTAATVLVGGLIGSVLGAAGIHR
jgi:hypothetical protein